MARIRLLAVWAAGLAVTCGACIHGRDIELPAVHGVLIDKETQQPVAGAEVFRHWTGRALGGPHVSPWIYSTPDWVTTDAQGRFSFPEVTVWENLAWWSSSYEVGFWVVDDRYGAPIVVYQSEGPEGLTLQVEKDGEEVGLGRSPDPVDPCDFNTKREGFLRCCTLLYPGEKCAEWRD